MKFKMRWAGTIDLPVVTLEAARVLLHTKFNQVLLERDGKLELALTDEEVAKLWEKRRKTRCKS